MSSETASENIVKITVYSGNGQAGNPIGGWSFSFALSGYPFGELQGSAKLINGSIGATINVPRAVGFMPHFVEKGYLLAFAGEGIESMASSPHRSHAVPVRAEFVVAEATGHGTGIVQIGNERLHATVTVKVKTIEV